MKSIYMDERWGILQQDKEKGTAVTYKYERKGDAIVYPFIKRKAGEIDGVLYFDIVTPRGHCGPWIDGQASQDIIKSFDKNFTEYCARENIIAEYVRFSPWLDHSHKFSKIYEVNPHGFVYCNNLECDFFKEEYSSKKRNEVRRAERNGVEIKFSKSPELIKDFLEIYDYTAEKYDISDYHKLDKSFLEKYFNLFPDQIVFANAIYEDEIISSAIILLGKEIAHYHFSASNPKYNYLQGNSLLLYESSIYAKEIGKKLFDFGGAKADSGLERFKKEFVHRANDYPYDYGTKIRNKEIYNKLVEQAGELEEGYFPAYRKKI